MKGIEALKGDVRAISPILGEIMMVAVLLVIATILVMIVYNNVWSTPQVATINIMITGAKVGSSNLTIVHLGGEKVANAFAPASSGTCAYYINDTIFRDIEVKINGDIFEGWASLNGNRIMKSDFSTGDELRLGLKQELVQGDCISVIYVPQGEILTGTMI
ncbi:MAG: type IV pilin N-terminal domain-containing protein [Methanophagales archaeon]|nr:type IV pilin N-terminal domain-containing protein [Methanophagales archaeon]